MIKEKLENATPTTFFDDVVVREYETAYRLGYNQAIDDFLLMAKQRKYHSSVTHENCVAIAELDWLAERLKKGTNND